MTNVYKGNILQPTKVWETSDGSKLSGSTDNIEFSGLDGSLATGNLDLGKAKAYLPQSKGQYDTSEWGQTPWDALNYAENG